MELDIQVRDTHRIKRRGEQCPLQAAYAVERNHSGEGEGDLVDAVFYRLVRALTQKVTVEQRLEGGKGRSHTEMQEGADCGGSSRHRSPAGRPGWRQAESGGSASTGLGLERDVVCIVRERGASEGPELRRDRDLGFTGSHGCRRIDGGAWGAGSLGGTADGPRPRRWQ